jgi:hypothetical protein
VKKRIFRSSSKVVSDLAENADINESIFSVNDLMRFFTAVPSTLACL